MAGGLTISTLNDSSGVLATQNGMSGIAKAWVNFNGATSPGTIRASFNVSSVTKNGTGDYTLNFTTGMPDTNYACAGVIQRRSSGFTGGFGIEADPTTTTTCRINTVAGGAVVDNTIVQVAVFR